MAQIGVLFCLWGPGELFDTPGVMVTPLVPQREKKSGFPLDGSPSPSPLTPPLSPNSSLNPHLEKKRESVLEKENFKNQRTPSEKTPAD